MDFSKTFNKIDQVVTNSFEKNLKAKIVRIETSVNSTQAKAFQMMARMIINSSGVPNLDRDTPVWASLNNRYKDRKRNSGFSQGFFERTGKLGNELKKLSSESVLGTPIVGLLGASGNKTTIITRRGRRTPITRDSKGRLTKLSVTKQKHTIIIDPYPAIDESLKSNIDEMKYLPADMATKLRSPRGRRLRPILAQYLNWYMKTEIRVAVRRSL